MKIEVPVGGTVKEIRVAPEDVVQESEIVAVVE